MSQVIPFNQAALPAFLQQASGAANINQQAATGTGGGQQVDHISIKGGRFHVVRNGQQPVTLQLFALNVVMVHINSGITKAFFDKPWVEGQEPEAPVCSSDDGVAPRSDADKPQCASCAVCPNNAFGSKITEQGKQAKLCIDKKTIAVVTPGAEGGEMLRLQIPAASLKDFGMYLRSLPNVPYYGVVTEITFDTTVSYPKLLFKPVGYVSEQGYAIVAQRHATEEAKAIAGVAGSTPLRSPAPQAAPQLAPPPAHMQQQQIPVQQIEPQYQQPQQTIVQQPVQPAMQQFAQPQQTVVQQPQQFVQQQQTAVQQPVHQQQTAVHPQVAPLSQAPQPVDPNVAAIFGGQVGNAQQPAAGAAQPTPVAQSSAPQGNFHPSGREYGKPPSGKKRRTKAEMAEDAAVGFGSAPGEQSEEDDNASQQQQQAAGFGQVQQPAQQQVQYEQPAQQQPAQVQQQQPAQGGFGQPVQQAQPVYQQPANQPQVMQGAAVDAFAGWDD